MHFELFQLFVLLSAWFVYDFTTNCEPKYLLMVFAFAGDSTITKARLFAADVEAAVLFEAERGVFAIIKKNSYDQSKN